MKHLKEFEDLTDWTEDLFDLVTKFSLDFDTSNYGVHPYKTSRGIIDAEYYKRLDDILNSLVQMVLNKGNKITIKARSLTRCIVDIIGLDLDSIRELISEQGTLGTKPDNGTLFTITEAHNPERGSLKVIWIPDGGIRGYMSL